MHNNLIRITRSVRQTEPLRAPAGNINIGMRPIGDANGIPVCSNAF